MPAQVEHGWCHDNAAMTAGGGRDKLEFRGNRADIFRNRQMKGKDIDVVADPR